MDIGIFQQQVETPSVLPEQADDQSVVQDHVAAPQDHAPMLSIILPTRNESGNIQLLLSRIEAATQGIPTQVIFVDDSTDDTAQVINEVVGLFPMGASVIVRPPEERHDGLGGAVLKGLREAKAPWVCVMDADLQHPPEVIPQLLERARHSSADVVLASRRTAQSREKGLNPLRQLISRTLDGMARLLFPSNLRNVSDPLTGFFVARRDAIMIDELRPREGPVSSSSMISLQRSMHSSQM